MVRVLLDLGVVPILRNLIELHSRCVDRALCRNGSPDVNAQPQARGDLRGLADPPCGYRLCRDTPSSRASRDDD